MMEKQQIPVIFYHTGNQEYLKIALEQCKKYNQTVILLGDSSNKEMAVKADCFWYPVENYDKKSQWKRFEQAYVGMSTNDYRFELNCFRRFFVIDEFIKELEIDKFIYLDSDILTYVNFSELDGLQKLDCGMSVPEEQSKYGWVANCGISLWNQKSVASFLEYCIDIYENHLELLEEKWNYHKENQVPGGICDMTLQYLWYKNDNTCRKVNLVDRENGLAGVMDFNVNLATNCYKEEYQMNRMVRIKKILIENGQSFLYDRNGNEVRVFAIHFLGPAKQYMKSYAYNRKLVLKDYLICYLKRIKAFVVR